MSVIIELTDKEYDELIKELKELDESSEKAIVSSKELIEKLAVIQ